MFWLLLGEAMGKYDKEYEAFRLFEQIQKQVEAGAYECRRYPKKEEQK